MAVMRRLRTRIAGAYRADRLVWRGTLLIVALAALIAVLEILATRPFSSIDENAHTAYAYDVSSGVLPTMHSEVDPVLPGAFRQPIYVANHPPLYYVFAGAVLRAGMAVGHPMVGFFGVRLVSLLFFLIGLVLTVALVRAVVPRQPRLALAVGALIAPLPLFSGIASTVINDTAGFATTNAALLLCVLVVKRGASWQRVGWLSLACLAAALTRSSGLMVAPIAVLAVALAWWNSAPRSFDAYLRQHLAKAAVVVLAVIGGAGWFYLRNEHLYGDATGARLALKMFPAPHVQLPSAIFSWNFWRSIYWNAFGHTQYLHNGYGTLIRISYVVLTIGLAWQLARWILRLALSRRRRIASRVGVSEQTLALLAVHAALVVGLFLIYASRGGATFARYLVPAMVFLGLLAAWALDGLPLRRYVIPVGAAIGLLTLCAVQMSSDRLQFRDRAMVGQPTFHRLVTGMQRTGVPAPAAAVALLVALTACACVGVLWSLYQARPTESDRDRLALAALAAATSGLGIRPLKPGSDPDALGEQLAVVGGVAEEEL